MCAQSLNTIGSIATFIVQNLTGLPAGVSGGMVQTVDLARQHVANFTNNSIGSNSISDKFQPAIVDWAKADAVELANAGAGDKIQLADLTIDSTGEPIS